MALTIQIFWMVLRGLKVWTANRKFRLGTKILFSGQLEYHNIAAWLRLIKGKKVDRDDTCQIKFECFCNF